MDNHQPKRLITRILEFAVLSILAVFLIRFAVAILLDIWPVLLVLAIVIVGIVIGYRIRRNRKNVKW